MSARFSSIGRRRFIQVAVAGVGLGAISPLASAKSRPREAGVILFQGNSITDYGRSKTDQRANAPQSLGNGYVYLAAAQLLAQDPEGDWTIYNRGISGWHTLTNAYAGTVGVYERDYRALLDRTRSALPDVLR